MVADDLLLSGYEPVIRFTRGEHFFPVAVEHYVAHAALWTETPDGAPAPVAEAGTLDLAS